ncbi:MAG: hypothetical protein NC131_18440 [Roseburia sp.]|nr:hypothetical protein [Roseburia sp.]
MLFFLAAALFSLAGKALFLAAACLGFFCLDGRGKLPVELSHLLPLLLENSVKVGSICTECVHNVFGLSAVCFELTSLRR